jgi:hypothetical protein
LGNFESQSLRAQIEATPLDRPVIVTGIARAGTTILLEALARHRQLGTHRYRDFPGQFIPVWWNRGQTPDDSTPQERAHGDRLAVTQDSPEAMEEPLWMAFFPGAHRPEVCNVLDRRTSNPKFERFYRDHIRKLLITRERPRYAAKANYNLTRLGYLQSILPDAKFIVAVRHPREHVASLVKQHRLFCAGETEFPRALAHMRRVGHFEFGLDRRPINVGDGAAAEVEKLWASGEEIRGTARYWASLYGWLLDELQRDPALRAAVKLVRYEDLCAAPAEQLAAILHHCELPDDEAVSKFAAEITPPRYYAPSFTSQEESAIAEETHAVAERFGYNAEVENRVG